MIEFDSDERLIAEVRKDPFGLFLIYAGGTFVTLILFFLIVIGGGLIDMSILTDGTGVSSGLVSTLLVFVGFLLCVGSVVITAIRAWLYQNNLLLVTSEKVSQLMYPSLFNRKISQLSIADVQDVTVRQQGIFSHIFNYGTITIETAGEQSNYTYTYAPDPYIVAKAIVGSHEADVAKHGN